MIFFLDRIYAIIFATELDPCGSKKKYIQRTLQYEPAQPIIDSYALKEEFHHILFHYVAESYFDVIIFKCKLYENTISLKVEDNLRILHFTLALSAS